MTQAAGAIDPYSRQIPTGVKEVFASLPAGVLQVNIASAELGYAGREGAQRLSFLIKMEVEEPLSHAGIEHEEKFFIGTDDDPDANQDATWIDSYGSRRMKQLCSKVGIDYEASTPAMVCSSLVQRKVKIHTETKLQPELNKDGSPNQYAGNPRTNIARYYSISEADKACFINTEAPVQAASTPATRPGAGARPSAPAPGPRPAANSAQPAPPAQPRRLAR